MDKPLSTEQVSAYLAQLGHEMRSPLHSILGFTHMLSEACEQPPHLEWLGHIRSSSQHLLELINDIIDLELLNNHKVTVADEAIDIFELVKRLQQGLQPQAIIGQLKLDCHIDADCPRVWRGDKRKLKQILINLIANAIKFTPPQGQITVSLSQVPSGLRISVQDTGIGINTDALSQLFTPFYHDTSLLNQQGVGIGLAITRRLIELMQGEILVNSQPEEGCEFIIILPLLVAQTQNLAVATNTSLPELTQSTSVLLVDDDRLHHEVFHGMVQHLPLIVYNAMTAEQALKLYQQQQPQLVLIDYRLPDSDGLTLAKKIRHLSHHQHGQPTRVLMLTAQSAEHFESALLDGTLDAWLAKPLSVAELILLANEYHLSQQLAPTPHKPETSCETPNAPLHLAIEQLPSYLRNLWPEFTSELRNGILYCQQMLDSNKMTELMTKAHQLKGQAMVFQQRPLIELLEHLEHHAQNRDIAACQPILTQASLIESTTRKPT